MRKNCIVIPALEPDERLYEYIIKLMGCIRACIVVVDDGSGPGYRLVFDRIREMRNCVVLKHDVNRGKGRALKTAFSYLMEHVPEAGQIVCVDCDGQHAPGDVSRIFRAAKEEPGALHLGGRDFSGETVPFRSRLGNRAASCLFWLICGKWIGDTQTGLRAFDKSLLPEMLSIPGERFEYETQMLLTCVRDKIPVRTQSIQTIYEEGNEGSHFRPVKDSIRVLKILFSEIMRFGMSSLFCAALDVFLFWGFSEILSGYLSGHPFFTGIGNQGGSAETLHLQVIIISTLCARLAASVVNYILNRDHVLKGEDGARGRPGAKYAALCVGIGCVSALSVYFLNRMLFIRRTVAKVITDLALFFVSYRVQKSWVFCGRRDEAAAGKGASVKGGAAKRWKREEKEGDTRE